MVILGGLELVAAGYLYHKHEQNKKEKLRLREEEDAIEDEICRLKDKRRHGHSPNSKHRRRKADYEYLSPDGQNHGRKHRRDHSAPPVAQAQSFGGPPPVNHRQLHHAASFASPPLQQPMSPPPAYPGVVTGWPAHWEQSRPNGPGGPMSAPMPIPGAYRQPGPQQMSLPNAQSAPPMEYGWKPGVEYADAPTETAQEREERRQKRREERREQRKRTVSAGEVDREREGSGSGSGSGSGGNARNWGRPRIRFAFGQSEQLSQPGEPLPRYSKIMQAGGGGGGTAGGGGGGGGC